MRYWIKTIVVLALVLEGGSAGAGSHYSIEQYLSCSDAIVEVEVPIVIITAQDEERWQRNGRLPRIWHVGRKKARLFPIAGPHVTLEQISSWGAETPPVPEIVLWKQRRQGKVRVLLFLQRATDGKWRYVLRRVNGFPNDRQYTYTETVATARQWHPGTKPSPEECSEWG